MDIFDKISSTRRELGLSQSEVAKLAGCSLPLVSRVERGEDVTLSSVLKIAGALDLSVVLMDRQTEFENELKELEKKKTELEAMIRSRTKLLDDYKSKRNGLQEAI